MVSIPEFTYGEPLGVKFGWMQAGPGAGPAIVIGQGLTELATRFERSDSTIGASLSRQLNLQWQGRAAGAADGAVSQAAAMIAASAQAGRSGGSGSERYGDSFGQVKRAIYVPEKLAASINSGDPIGQNSAMGELADGFGDALHDAFGSTFGIQSDYRARKQAYDEADRAAVEALKAHEARTREALTAFQAAVPGAQHAAQRPAGDAPVDGTGRRPGGADVGTPGGSPPAGGPASRPVDTSARAGAAAVDTQLANVGDGRTPPPDSAGPSLAPGVNGGPVSAPTSPYTPSPQPRAGGFTHGRLGGQEAAPRGRSVDPATETAGRPPGGGPATPRGPAGLAPPIGMGAGLGGRGKDHRNQYYIPEDEPFRVEYDFFVSPAVIGAPEPEDG